MKQLNTFFPTLQSRFLYLCLGFSKSKGQERILQLIFPHPNKGRGTVTVSCSVSTQHHSPHRVVIQTLCRTEEILPLAHIHFRLLLCQRPSHSQITCLRAAGYPWNNEIANLILKLFTCLGLSETFNLILL